VVKGETSLWVLRPQCAKERITNAWCERQAYIPRDWPGMKLLTEHIRVRSHKFTRPIAFLHFYDGITCVCCSRSRCECIKMLQNIRFKWHCHTDMEGL
jgi:hypothetical protein